MATPRVRESEVRVRRSGHSLETAVAGTAASGIAAGPRYRRRRAPDRCGATRVAWEGCSAADPAGNRSDSPVPAATAERVPWLSLSFTWPSRNRERNCSAWVEPLCSFTLTVIFWPGEIAASGSSPGAGGELEPGGETSEAWSERLSARLSAIRACDSFSRKRASTSCFCSPARTRSSRRLSDSITDSSGAAALPGSFSAAFAASAHVASESWPDSLLQRHRIRNSSSANSYRFHRRNLFRGRLCR